MTKGANAGRTQKKAGREQRNGLTTISQAARRECRTLRELPSPSLHATGAKFRSGISHGVAPPGANVGVASGEEAAAPGGGLALTVIQDPDETEGVPGSEDAGVTDLLGLGLGHGVEVLGHLELDLSGNGRTVPPPRWDDGLGAGLGGGRVLTRDGGGGNVAAPGAEAGAQAYNDDAEEEDACSELREIALGPRVGRVDWLGCVG